MLDIKEPPATEVASYFSSFPFASYQAVPFIEALLKIAPSLEEVIVRFIPVTLLAVNTKDFDVVAVPSMYVPEAAS